MFISMKDVQVAQTRYEDYRRQAAKDILAEQVNGKGVTQVVADRFTGVRAKVGNWVGSQLVVLGERLQNGYTPHRV